MVSTDVSADTFFIRDRCPAVGSRRASG